MNQSTPKQSDGNDRTKIEGDPDEGKQEYSGSDEGVDVPEEFQAQAHNLVKNATKSHLAHLRMKMDKREDEIRTQEHKKKAKTVPKEFSLSDMPQD